MLINIFNKNKLPAAGVSSVSPCPHLSLITTSRTPPLSLALRMLHHIIDLLIVLFGTCSQAHCHIF